MQFVQSFLLIASAVLIFSVGAYALSQRRQYGARSLSALAFSTVIWSVGSFFESSLPGFEMKLFWRNFQQLGVFAVPLSALIFAVVYTRADRLKLFALISLVIETISVLLIWTDPWHHLMRRQVTLEKSTLFGQVLVVKSTPLGAALVAYNFMLPLIACGLLLWFARRVAPEQRKNVLMIVLSMLMTFSAAWLKTTLLEKHGIYIQIAVLYVPGILVLFAAMFRYRFFRISPVARDKVFEVLQQGIVVIDASGRIVEINGYARGILERFLPDVAAEPGQDTHQYREIHPVTGEILNCPADLCREVYASDDKGTAVLEVCHYHLKTGSQAVGSVILIQDVTLRRMHEQRLIERAESDVLTGLMNREGCLRAIAKLDSERSSLPLTVMMLDLDRFKRINDTYGHDSGDRVLVHFAELLRMSLREGDIPVRMGGEEFAVFLPETCAEDARVLAERIRRMTEYSSVILKNNTILSYTVSIGMASSQQEEMPAGELLHCADTALYAAKRSSRNCVRMYSELPENERNGYGSEI